MTCVWTMRRRWVWTLVLAMFLAGARDSAGQALDDGGGERYWQLTFLYDRDSLALLKAVEIPRMEKPVTGPGLRGAVDVVEVVVDWLNEQGQVLESVDAEMPVGERSILGEGDEPCELLVLEEGVIVVRTRGPGWGTFPAALRLSRPQKAGVEWPHYLPQSLNVDTVEFSLAEAGYWDGEAGAKAQGPASATKIHNTGPNSNRLVVVVMGDGYTAENLAAGDFAVHASNLVSAFAGKSPWNVYLDGTNIYRVDVVSNEQGADNEDGQNGTKVDTYFNSAFWTAGSERLLTIDGTGMARAVNAADNWVGAGVWDHIFVLVNSTKYGGAGGVIGVSSVHSASSEIILHEFGHSFAGLADEYTTAYPGVPLADPEPNVDKDYQLNLLKWAHWVEPGTPLPTPDTSAYENVVGAFEGARYYTTGIYRPWRRCLMNSLNREFCPVCKEQHVLDFFGTVKLIDSVSPPKNSTVTVSSGGTTISSSPIPIGGLTYTWRLNNSVISWAQNSSITLQAGDLPSGSSTLRLTVSHPTALVRSAAINQSVSWTVEPAASVTTPVNDRCNDALPIALGETVTGSTVGASMTSAVCGVRDRHDVWHVFSSPITGVVKFSTCSGANFDTTVSVYDDCGGTLLACNDNSCGMLSSVEIPVVAGGTYYIRVAGVEWSQGTYSLTAEEVISTVICRDGDVNGDCQVTPADALLLFEHYLGLIELDLEQQYRGDIVNPQNPPLITPADGECIFKFFLGDPASCLTGFPAACSPCGS